MWLWCTQLIQPEELCCCAGLIRVQVKFTEKKKSFLHFLTNVCAIVGGEASAATFILAGLKRTVNSACLIE